MRRLKNCLFPNFDSCAIVRLVILSLLFVPASCALLPSAEREEAAFTSASFSDLEGWDKDTQAQALKAFRRSCSPLRFKAGWKEVCAKLPAEPVTDEAARRYFEDEFVPYVVSGGDGGEGLFTGYYMPELYGSMRRHGDYDTPLYERPKDLIAADLGAFKPELEGQRIVGKVKGTKFIPYDERAAIARGALSFRAKPIVWVDDPVDAFFLEIQGSGRVVLPNGKRITLGYDGANGRGYVAVGRVLADRCELPRPVTMEAIRTWMYHHPDRAQEIMNANKSYIFFRRVPGEDAVGAQGVALTAMRSLAVDPKAISLGSPVWLETTDGIGAPLRRLMVAQDTGGAIKGAVRGDIYWGFGDAAAEQAGAMQSRGKYFVLFPKGMKADDER